MTNEQLKSRINNALEAELAKIYDELRIESGDIAPWDLLEWEQITEEAAALFERLIAMNAGEED
jgi:hypothetical protein